jgi:hypothetical protein
MDPQPGQVETKQMEDQFASFRKTLIDMNCVLGQMQEDSAESNPKIASLKDGIFCLELALMFYEEANLAVQAGAWFAAASVASSSLESVLLSKCFFQEEEIKALPKFQKFDRRYDADFGLFARSLDLGKLLEIANELSWFPDDGISEILRSFLASYFDEETLSSVIGQFEGISNIGRICAGHVRKYRNLLHPAVCLKERHQPSKEAGLTATFLFTIAFGSLAKV